MRHTCIIKLGNSYNGLLPVQCQAIIYTNAVVLLIEPLETTFLWIQINIKQFSFKKFNFKMLSAKQQALCFSLNVLKSSCSKQVFYKIQTLQDYTVFSFYWTPLSTSHWSVFILISALHGEAIRFCWSSSEQQPQTIQINVLFQMNRHPIYISVIARAQTSIGSCIQSQ